MERISAQHYRSTDGLTLTGYAVCGQFSLTKQTVSMDSTDREIPFTAFPSSGIEFAELSFGNVSLLRDADSYKEDASNY